MCVWYSAASSQRVMPRGRGRPRRADTSTSTATQTMSTSAAMSQHSVSILTALVSCLGLCRNFTFYTTLKKDDNDLVQLITDVLFLFESKMIMSLILLMSTIVLLYTYGSR